MTHRTLVHRITDAVPEAEICAEFGVKERSIRLAKERGVFPAGWYRGMSRLCAKHGVECPFDAFNFKSSAIKGGDDSTPVQGSNA